MTPLFARLWWWLRGGFSVLTDACATKVSSEIKTMDALRKKAVVSAMLAECSAQVEHLSMVQMRAREMGLHSSDSAWRARTQLLAELLRRLIAAQSGRYLALRDVRDRCEASAPAREEAASAHLKGLSKLLRRASQSLSSASSSTSSAAAGSLRTPKAERQVPGAMLRLDDDAHKHAAATPQQRQHRSRRVAVHGRAATQEQRRCRHRLGRAAVSGHVPGFQVRASAFVTAHQRAVAMTERAALPLRRWRRAGSCARLSPWEGCGAPLYSLMCP